MAMKCENFCAKVYSWNARKSKGEKTSKCKFYKFRAFQKSCWQSESVKEFRKLPERINLCHLNRLVLRVNFPFRSMNILQRIDLRFDVINLMKRVIGSSAKLLINNFSSELSCDQSYISNFRAFEMSFCFTILFRTDFRGYSSICLINLSNYTISWFTFTTGRFER